MNCYPPEVADATRTKPDKAFVPSPKKFRAEDPPETGDLEHKRRRKSSNRRREEKNLGKSNSTCKSNQKSQKNYCDSDLTTKNEILNFPERRRQPQRRGSTVVSISVKEVALERKADELSELTLRGCGGKDPEERIIESIPRRVKTRDPLPLLAASSRRAARRASKSGRCRSSTVSSPVSDELPTRAKTRKKAEKSKPRSILRNSSISAPPPIRYFGCASSDGTDDVSSIEDSCSEVTTVIDMGSSEGTSVRSVQSPSRSTNSALRRGKYTSSLKDDEGSFDGSDTDTELQFHREKSFFMRTADLGLTQDTVFAQQFMETSSSEPEPHYHQPSPRPPPGVQFNVDENWVSIDDGNGGHSPIAPQAVDALVSIGYKVANDPMMWTPTSKTRKFCCDKRLAFNDTPIPGPRVEGTGSALDSECMLWTGKFNHKYYGSDLPAVRAVGIVNMCAEDLVDLLMDSNRVGEYNKASKGRRDELTLSDGKKKDCPFSGRRKKKLSGVVIQGSLIVDGCAQVTSEDDGGGSSGYYGSTTSSRRKDKASRHVGVTKIVRSRNQVPLIRRELEFTSLLHCRELLEEQGGNGYIICARSVVPADDLKKEKRVIHSEALLNVYIIRRLHQKNSSKVGRDVSISESGRDASKKDLRNRCLLIKLAHVKSPLIPRMVAKRIGLAAAANHIHEIRNVISPRTERLNK